MRFNSLFKIRKEESIEFYLDLEKKLREGVQITYSFNFRVFHPTYIKDNTVKDGLFPLLRIVNSDTENFSSENLSFWFPKIPLFPDVNYDIKTTENYLWIHKLDSKLSPMEESLTWNKMENAVREKTRFLKAVLDSKAFWESNSIPLIKIKKIAEFNGITSNIDEKNILEIVNFILNSKDSYCEQILILDFLTSKNLRNMESFSEIIKTKRSMESEILEIAEGKKQISEDFFHRQNEYQNLFIFGNENKSK